MAGNTVPGSEPYWKAIADNCEALSVAAALDEAKNTRRTKHKSLDAMPSACALMTVQLMVCNFRTSGVMPSGQPFDMSSLLSVMSLKSACLTGTAQ